MLSKDQIKQILADQRATILNKPLGIERTLLSDIDKTIKLPQVVVITGMRRVGKSTLMRQIIKKYYNDQHFYYINFEDERLFKFKAEDFNLLYEALIELYGEHQTFFIDEIQNIEHFENFVRRFYDSGFKFFITGSSARLLSREMATHLTGRFIPFNLYTFSFQEFLKARGVNLNDAIKITDRGKILYLLDQYQKMGGYPEIIVNHLDPKDYLNILFSSIIFKDVVKRYNVRYSQS